MEPDSFLDTNIVLRHLLQDHTDHSPRATHLIAAIEHGERVVRIADSVVFEAVFTLEKTYGVPRAAIRDVMMPILDLPGIVLPGKRLFPAVFALYVEEAGLSFADCYHVTLAKQLGLNTMLSFDRKLNRIPDISRQEP